MTEQRSSADTLLDMWNMATRARYIETKEYVMAQLVEKIAERISVATRNILDTQ